MKILLIEDEARILSFLARGLTPDDCFSDAFKLVPHLAKQAESADLVKLGGAP